MEPNELQATWRLLERQLDRQNRVNFAMLRHQQLTGARRAMRPLHAGQVAQICLGVATLVLAVLLWSTAPTALPIIVAGVLLNAYGVAAIVSAGLVLAALSRLDYAGAVIAVQQELARVRRAYAIGTLAAGLTWWYLWIVLALALAGLSGINLYAHAPSFVWDSAAVGTAGLAGMLWLYAYSRKHPDTRLRRLVDDSVFGKSLQRAQAQLEAIRRFEQDLA